MSLLPRGLNESQREKIRYLVVNNEPEEAILAKIEELADFGGWGRLNNRAFCIELNNAGYSKASKRLKELIRTK